MNRRRIIDAHHHLWDLQACHYPWLNATGVPRFFGDPTPIQKNYLVSDLRSDAADYELIGSVHVQVGVADGEELAETRWLEKTADADGLPSAIVAFCNLAGADVHEKLNAQLSSSRVRGVRQIIGRSPDEDALTGSGNLLHDPRWRDGLRQAAELGLSFDLQLIPSQLPHAAEVMATVPGLRIALCHCGSPWDQTRRGLKRWKAGLKLLAQLPKTHCKISGLGMFNHRWTEAGIRPIVETCIEIFGTNRCMFGSNFPVDKLHASYTEVWRAFANIADKLDSKDSNRLFIGTAAEFYGLGDQI
jgi:predicted TIM-barrel fold metal-dependent hydrolase